MMSVTMNHMCEIPMLILTPLSCTKLKGFYVDMFDERNELITIWCETFRSYGGFNLIQNPEDILKADRWDSHAYEGTLVRIGKPETRRRRCGLVRDGLQSDSRTLYRIIGINDKVHFSDVETVKNIVHRPYNALFYQWKDGPIYEIMLLEEVGHCRPRLEVKLFGTTGDEVQQGQLMCRRIGEVSCDFDFEIFEICRKRIYNHTVKGSILFNGYCKEKQKKVAVVYVPPHGAEIESSDHPPVTLTGGWWLLEHPRPTRTCD